jgi:pyruvate dehydrogenase E1 component beta subunit
MTVEGGWPMYGVGSEIAAQIMESMDFFYKYLYLMKETGSVVELSYKM